MSNNILIVDDSLTVRMDLTEAFEAAGLPVLACDSLAAARRLLAAEAVGLVVLDVVLPDGDGIDLLRELRASPRHAGLSVLLLSNEAEVRHRIRGIRTGANEYVGKPYDTRYVVAKARELLGAGPTAAAKPTVLVIDDSEGYRATLAEALEGAGYGVLTAPDGRTGLAMIADRRPSAVLVDGVMPDMDGASVIRRVRLDAATRAMPCLLLTAYEERGSQLRALEAGTDAFVPKDGDMEVVLARLAVVMRRLADPAMAHIASLGGPRKILAVDDSPTFLAELSDALRGEGYEVSTAPSGEEAIELLAVQPVDCILMDLMMPGMGGREACLRIKAAPGVRDIPLILLTARDDRDTMLDGLSAGADDFIVKSSEFEVLAARVLTQIRRKQFEDESRRFRDELMGRELEAADERAARVVAETRAALVDELERKVEARTRELEALATERRQAERMASIGMLSASIAHEINNPLAVVTGNLDLVAIRLKEVLAEPQESAADSMPAELRELLASAEAPLHDALEAAERVREIVRDLKVFSRSDTDDVVGPVDLHEVIESSLRMTSNEIRHRAHFVRDFGEVPPVLGNPSRLGQVLLNLIVNAAQAIPPGQAGAHEVRVSTAMQSADHVLVEIADTGVGIPPDKLGKIFEPFFTTKPAGVGSGLGLAICHRIITELGGTISVDSIVGKGSVFRIVLRRATGCPDAELRPAASLAAPAPTIGRSARILVVDDEPALCSTIERILRREHEVVAVTSAEEATRIIETGERFDVILSDLMMPEMTGMELHALLMQMLPDQAGRMIFMSGGALTQEGAQFLRQQGCAAIDKPFRAAALRDLVRRAIEAVDRAA